MATRPTRVKEMYRALTAKIAECDRLRSSESTGFSRHRKTAFLEARSILVETFPIWLSGIEEESHEAE